MYENFYQLATNPFRLAPDPDFCFTHSGYKCAREYLEYALAQGEGFVMVTGRPGTGKTMLAETFLREIDVSQVTAKRITASNYSADDLLRSVAYAYGIDAANVDKATLRYQIQRYLLQQERAGRRVLLIIDEAQTLQHSALEELRIIADLQTQSRLMLQLFLIGQESLQDLMRTPDMEQFQQRVIANYHLVPLNLIDTRAYIEFRLVRAGWIGDPEFSSESVLSIYHLSKGVPRHINKICNRLMLLGYGKGSHGINNADVHAIAVEMREELLVPLDIDGAPTADADSPPDKHDVSEIRDAQTAGHELAINAENLDDRVTAISEASRLAAQRREQFEKRNDGPVSWAVQPSELATPAQIAGSDVNGSAAYSPADKVLQHDSALIGAALNQFKWREALVASAAALAITTISIAAIPTLLGEHPEQDSLSLVDDQQLPVDDAIPVASINRAEAPVVVAQVNVDTPVLTPAKVTADDVAVESVEPIQVAMAVMPEPERETRTAFSEIDGQQDDPVQQPVASELVQSAIVNGPLVPVDFEHNVQIQSLLSQGQRSIDDYRLMTPAGDSAYGYYNAVIALDPNNQTARDGMQVIVDRYITLTQQAINRHQKGRAARYADRGLIIQPDNRQLLALRSRLYTTPTAQDGVAVVERGVPVAHGSVTSRARKTDDDIMSRITTFFEKRKAEAARGEVTIPAGWDG